MTAVYILKEYNDEYTYEEEKITAFSTRSLARKALHKSVKSYFKNFDWEYEHERILDEKIDKALRANPNISDTEIDSITLDRDEEPLIDGIINFMVTPSFLKEDDEWSPDCVIYDTGDGTCHWIIQRLPIKEE